MAHVTVDSRAELEHEEVVTLDLPATRSGWRADLSALQASKWFLGGLVLRVLCAPFLGASVATDRFAPFLYAFAQAPFTDPYVRFVAEDPNAFPYGPVMLLLCALPYVPFAPFDIDPGGSLALFLLRVPVLAADLGICVLLVRWLRIRARIVVLVYWLSPIGLYASYVHGQLDLVPTALLCWSLFLLFGRRTRLGAFVFGVGLATKLHLLIALPFLFVFLYRLRRRRAIWLEFVGIAVATAAVLYLVPVLSPAFREMVFGTPQSAKLWAVQLHYGEGGLRPSLYLAPAMLLLGLVTFASYRKVNAEATFMFLGAMYVGLLALVPPQPGWYVWALPFLAYMGAQYNRTRRIQLLALSATYLAYFFVGRPDEFLESLDPLFGSGTGLLLADRLQTSLGFVFSSHGASVTFTALFAATVVAALELYRRGVRTNAVHRFRDAAFLIGIGGDSGAGKHTIGADLQALMGRQMTTLHGDDDHKWERGHEGWRQYTHLDPRANRLSAQFASLSALRRGGVVRKRHYDHDVGRFTDPIEIEDNNFIAVVGLHPFYLPSTRRLFHLKVFVNPEEEVRRKWKVRRDMDKRGYSKERVIEQIEARIPDSEKYVMPQMKYADVVVRHRGVGTRGTELADLEVEVGSDLDSIHLYERFEATASLKTAWEPNEDLTRDRIHISGTFTAAQARELADGLVPNIDHLVENEAWQAGGCGIVQVVLLHTISVRLRTEAEGA